MHSKARYLLPIAKGDLFNLKLLQSAAKKSKDLSFRLAISRDVPKNCLHYVDEICRLHPQIVPESPFFLDLTKMDDVHSVLEDCNGLILSSSQNNLEFMTQEYNLVQAAKTKDIMRAIKVSVSKGLMEFSQTLAVARNHEEIESELTNSGIPSTIVRMNSTMQSLTRGTMLGMIKEGKISASVKHGKIAFVDEDDVADVVIAQCLEQIKGRDQELNLNLTGPDAFTFQELAQILTEKLEQTIQYSYFPLWCIQPALWIKGARPEEIADAIARARALESGAEDAVTSDIANVLHRDPRSLHEFIEQHKQVWLKKVVHPSS